MSSNWVAICNMLSKATGMPIKVSEYPYDPLYLYTQTFFFDVGPQDLLAGLSLATIVTDLVKSSPTYRTSYRIHRPDPAKVCLTPEQVTQEFEEWLQNPLVLKDLQVFKRTDLTAKIVPGYVRLTSVTQLGGRTCLTVDCLDFDAFKALPSALEYEGKLFQVTGWNSDTGQAYYKDGTLLAKVVTK